MLRCGGAKVSGRGPKGMTGEGGAGHGEGGEEEEVKRRGGFGDGMGTMRRGNEEGGGTLISSSRLAATASHSTSLALMSSSIFCQWPRYERIRTRASCCVVEGGTRMARVWGTPWPGR